MLKLMDSGFRRNDEFYGISSFYEFILLDFHHRDFVFLTMNSAANPIRGFYLPFRIHHSAFEKLLISGGFSNILSEIRVKGGIIWPLQKASTRG
jgi:hypothetical protein